MSETNKCAACGSENSDQAKYCAGCGRPLTTLSEHAGPPATDDRPVCANCRYINQKGANYCRACGQSMAPELALVSEDRKSSRRFWPLLLVAIAILAIPIGFYISSGRDIQLPEPAAFLTDNETPTPEPTATKNVPTLAPTQTAVPSQTPLTTHTITHTPTLTPSPSATLTPEPTLSPTPEQDGIAVLSNRGDNGSSPGEDAIRLTFRPQRDYTPSLSPDQMKMVFSTEVDNFWLLAEIDPNSDDNVQFRYITTGNSSYQHPVFSPDGSSILTAADLDGDMDLYLLDPESGEVIRQLTDFPGKEITPTWVPDGRSILFTGYMDGEEEVYRFMLENEQTLKLTDNGEFDGFPSASPDGSQITYYSRRDGDYEIYVANIDGSDPQRVTDSPGRDASPVFSPDGNWIVFESSRSGNYEIYAMRPNGEELQNLTNSPGGDWFPSFSPDGQWLFFQSERDGDMDIYRQLWRYREQSDSGG